MAKSKDEEEVVMVMMKEMWDQYKIEKIKKERKLEMRDFADGCYRNMLVNSRRGQRHGGSINAD